MPAALKHSLYVKGDSEQAFKQAFVSGLRGFLLNDMAAAMKERYISDIEPTMAQKPKNGEEVHEAIKGTGLFKFYSSMRYNAQEMVWRSALRPLHRSMDKLSQRIDVVSANADKSKLTLNPNQEIPRNVSAIDVHLAPGSYHREDGSADWMGGALYDHGLNIFSFGMMGENLDDIGQSMAQYIARKFPDFCPSTILDLGCTVGHNTCAWKLTFPDAQVTGIDVASACLKYGHARALDQGVDINFKQMNATALDFADNSVDVVFSSMFLHELSVKDIRKVMEEAYRVLRPGGLMLHMELPPNDSLSPFDAFYLDWDAYYNNEPFYKSFRDQDFTQLRLDAGFKAERLIQLITPQYTYMDSAAYSQSIDVEQGFDDNTGRLAEGLQWFGFGAWK
jgi:ubiquinone/menaquinone biosynthesis C-methylase UbiE